MEQYEHLGGALRQPPLDAGLPERELCVEPTPGLNPHAQAEPPWLPVWTVDGDDARWIARAHGPDGEWQLDAEPDYSAGLGHDLAIYHTELGCLRGITVTPNQMRALMAIGREWLASVEAVAETQPQPPNEAPARIYFGSAEEREIRQWSMSRGTYRGYFYSRAAAAGAWIRGGAA